MTWTLYEYVKENEIHKHHLKRAGMCPNFSIYLHIKITAYRRIALYSVWKVTQLNLVLTKSLTVFFTIRIVLKKVIGSNKWVFNLSWPFEAHVSLSFLLFYHCLKWIYASHCRSIMLFAHSLMGWIRVLPGFTFVYLFFFFLLLSSLLSLQVCFFCCRSVKHRLIYWN